MLGRETGTKPGAGSKLCSFSGREGEAVAAWPWRLQAIRRALRVATTSQSLSGKHHVAINMFHDPAAAALHSGAPVTTGCHPQ